MTSEKTGGFDRAWGKGIRSRRACSPAASFYCQEALSQSVSKAGKVAYSRATSRALDMSKDNSGENPVKLPGQEDKEDVFEKGPNPRLIRLVTVMAYMFAISSTGMSLSIYYIFLWNPPEPKAHIVHKKLTNARPQYLVQDEAAFLDLFPDQRHTREEPKTWDEIVDEVGTSEPAKLARFLLRLKKPTPPGDNAVSWPEKTSTATSDYDDKESNRQSYVSDKGQVPSRRFM